MMTRQDDARDLDWGVVMARGGKFTGTAGDDQIVGTNGDDLFKVGQGGNDALEGGYGNDTFRVRASLTNQDYIDGGEGRDIIVISGNYAHDLVLIDGTLRNTEDIYFKGPGADGPANYHITLPINLENVVPNFFALNVSISGIDPQGRSHITLDGSDATNYCVNITGSYGDDVLFGGAYNIFFGTILYGDILIGGFGQDVMTGGAGKDSYVFYNEGESLPNNPDIITDFERSDEDKINLSNIESIKGRPLHFGDGETPNYIGDVLVNYDVGQNTTFINVHIDRDSAPDMVIQLEGDHSDLTEADFDFDPFGFSPSVAEHSQFPDLTPASHQIAIV